MRIGLLIYGSLDILTGGYFYDRQVVEAWRQAGDEVVILSLPWRGYWRHLADNFSAQLVRRLRELPVDVLIQDELCYPSLVWLSGQLQDQLPYPQLSLIHLLKQTEQHPAPQAAIYRSLENHYLRQMDGFIYNSQDSRRLVEAIVPGAAGVVAYPGWDHLQVATERREAAGPVRIIAVGNLMRRKGQHLLLQALAELPELDWRLTLAGSGEFEPAYERELRALAQAKGLAERVEFLGRQPNEKIGALLAEHDLFVLPSSYEGFGIVYLEAQLAGLPVIATTAGAAGEILVDGETGYLLPADNVPALRACLAELLADRSRLRQMAARATARACEFPTWAQTAATIRQFAGAAIEAFHD